MSNFWHFWCEGGAESSSTSKYATRGFDDHDGDYVQGPLMAYPGNVWGWLGSSTDYGMPIAANVNLNAGATR